MRDIERFFLKTLSQKKKKKKPLATQTSRSNACRLLSLGPIEGQSVQKYTPRTIEQLKDAIRQEVQAVSMSTLWQKYSRIWRNAFKCAWM
jgi:hypothetical protein